VRALLLSLLLAPATLRAGDEGPRSGAFCGADAAGRLAGVFGRVARAAGLEWSGTSGRDPGTGRAVAFVFDPGHRNVSYDCEARRPAEGASIGYTALCDEAIVVVFGAGICEAARGADEAAFAAAHEISHVFLNHWDALLDFEERTFESWLASELGVEERRRLRRELGPRATPERVEDRLWRRFQQQSAPVRERFLRGQETEADQEALNLVGTAGFDRAGAAALLRHAAELRIATHRAPSPRHPPSAARERLLESLAAELRGPSR
jgi:hypothetical protein